jgi:biopolymer transport protein ExbB/TolQ
MDMYNTVVGFFQSGGIFMYPIVIVLALGMAIAIERWFYLSIARSSNHRLWKKIQPHLAKGDLMQVALLTEKSRSAISHIFSYGLSRARTSRRRDDVEIAMEEGLMETVPNLEKRTGYLATFANIATLLGLLGTIIGLIKAFTAVAAANPSEKADMLSASISVAMNTTAFGLMVAIPLLLIYAVLQTKTTQMVDSLEMASVKFLNSLTDSPVSGGAKAG